MSSPLHLYGRAKRCFEAQAALISTLRMDFTGFNGQSTPALYFRGIIERVVMILVREKRREGATPLQELIIRYQDVGPLPPPDEEQDFATRHLAYLAPLHGLAGTMGKLTLSLGSDVGCFASLQEALHELEGLLLRPTTPE